jgi:AraC-like DNA-binding protein
MPSELCLQTRSPRYEEIAPAAALAGFLACFWSFTIPEEAASFQHAIIPDGTVSLAVIRKRRPDLRLLTLTSPSATARWVTVNPGDAFWGARLLPGAAHSLLGIPPRLLRDKVQPLADLIPSFAHDMLASLATVESAAQAFDVMASGLQRLAARASPIDAVVRETVAQFERTLGNAKIAGLAAGVGMSERQFRRRFSAAVGLSPKQFSRAIRVRAACIRLALSKTARIAAIAQDVGYADQAHLAREFSEVFGSPTSELSALIRSFQHSQFAGFGRVRFIQDTPGA